VLHPNSKIANILKAPFQKSHSRRFIVQRWLTIWCTPPNGSLFPDESVDNSGM